MAQLKLSLPESDVAAIRALADQQNQSVSAFLRSLALGQSEAPDRLEDQARQLASLSAAVQALEGSDPLDQVEALDRRLSRLEELAGL